MLSAPLVGAMVWRLCMQRTMGKLHTILALKLRNNHKGLILFVCNDTFIYFLICVIARTTIQLIELAKVKVT